MNFSDYKLGHCLLQAILLCYPIAVWAEIYQWKDTKGHSHYSYQAIENSKKIVVKPGYSLLEVDKVFDGDTIKLKDGRKIRFLGINTPEIKHKNQDAQAGGETAKQWLANKLKNHKVRLVSDFEQTDKYHRTLAHVFTDDKQHLNAQLVELGLAAVNIYPPNLLYADELIAAGLRAEQAKRGIWQQGEYRVISANDLNDDGHSGWTRLQGKVSVIRSSRKFIYLEFTDLFQARIEKKWLSLFPEKNSYLGKIIEVRGWLNKNRGGWSMLIRHPSAIKTLTNPPNI